jgi:hypothetical protein
MSSIGISANVELTELVDMIIDGVRDHETIRNFILALDLAVADYDFTVDLRDKLNEAIDAEDRAASAT